jgi:integrase/recombinase XerC
MEIIITATREQGPDAPIAITANKSEALELVDDSLAPDGSPSHEHGPKDRHMKAVILDILRDDSDELTQGYLKSIPTANTRGARAQDLRDFRARLGTEMEALLEGPSIANRMVAEWRDKMIAAGLHPRTINRRLGTAKDFLRWARANGYASHAIDVKGAPKGKRPMRQGPGESAVSDLWKCLCERDDPAAPRDRAIFVLLYVHALRLSEVLGLDVGDVDLGKPEIMIRRKGRKMWKEPIALEPRTAEVIEDWLRKHPFRTDDNAPVFLGRDQRQEWTRSRLTPGRARILVKKWGALAGIEGPVRPHGLRHTHATIVIDRAGAETAKCSLGHSSLATLSQYDDGETRRALEGRVGSRTSQDALDHHPHLGADVVAHGPVDGDAASHFLDQFAGDQPSVSSPRT